MKKLISLTLALAFVLAFAACSKETPVNADIKAYFDQGYEVGMTTSSGDKWSGILQKDNSYVKISSAITKQQQEAFNELDFSDADYAKKEQALITSLVDATIEDLSSQVPSQDELDTYVGKTLGEMEEAGWENIGTLADDDEYVVTLDGPVYQINVTVSDDVDLSNLDNYSPNQINEFKIATAEFVGFAWGILE